LQWQSYASKLARTARFPQLLLRPGAKSPSPRFRCSLESHRTSLRCYFLAGRLLGVTSAAKRTAPGSAGLSFNSLAMIAP
jgi:hypothetical protein